LARPCKNKNPVEGFGPQGVGEIEEAAGISAETKIEELAKQRLSDALAYVFRHRVLGELRRILLQELDYGRCHISCEVVVDPSDPMTQQRTSVFKPLGPELTRKMEADLSSNQLSTVPEAMQSLVRLKNLFLHGNPGLNLPDEVLGPTNIEVVSLNRSPKPARNPRLLLRNARGEGEGVARGEADRSRTRRCREDFAHQAA
jgi:hypothetical protein